MKVLMMMRLENPAAVEPRKRARINELLRQLGSTVTVERMAAACTHPWTRIDGEYLKCGVCGTIVGSSGQ